MGAERELIKKIKRTAIGDAAAWLMRPRKHYRDVARHLERQLPYPPSKKQIWWCFWDYFGFRLQYRGDLEADYFGAQLYRKSGFVRQESMAHAVRFAWRNAVQDKKHWTIFQDKREFYAAFSKHLKRKWMIADQGTAWEAFSQFISECSDRIFVKDPMSMGGRGVALWTFDGEEKRRELFELCRETPMVLEEVLTQCEEIRAFSGSSVNTLRVITIVDRYGEVHIARCELRMGRRDMDIDNFCRGGLVAQVDADTGVVFSMGKDGNGRDYIFHPDSGKQIVGFSIPDWDGYKRFACELASKYPEMRYVGWDIVKDSKGNFCVIEGNKDAGVGGLESGLLYGLKPYFDALLDGNKTFPYHQ